MELKIRNLWISNLTLVYPRSEYMYVHTYMCDVNIRIAIIDRETRMEMQMVMETDGVRQGIMANEHIKHFKVNFPSSFRISIYFLMNPLSPKIQLITESNSTRAYAMPSLQNHIQPSNIYQNDCENI